MSDDQKKKSQINKPGMQMLPQSNDKNTRATSMGIVLVLLLLTLSRYYPQGNSVLILHMR